MLILSRKTNQNLLIGDSIKITVVEVRDGHVRLGITAPKNVPVFREELLEEVMAQNLEAMTSARTVDIAIAGAAHGSDPVVAVLNPSGPALEEAKGGHAQ